MIQVFEKKRGRTVARKSNKKIRVCRDTYKRKDYTREDGTKVKGAKVDGSCFLIDDPGKPGRDTRGSKAGPYRDEEKWIQKEGTLGKGFLTTMSQAQRHKALDKCVKKFGYRSCLGKVQALNRSSTLKKKYGSKLTESREYLVKKFGKRESNPGTLKATVFQRQPEIARLRNSLLR